MPRIAYVVSRFPHLSETFVLREFDALDRRPGFDVALCPLLRHCEAVSQPAAEQWVERAWYTPFVSRDLLRDAVRVVARSPAATARSIAEALARVVRTPNFLVGTAGIVLKSLHLARRMQEEGVDHVHAHFATHAATAAWIVNRATGIPFSFTAHAHDIYVDTAMLREKMAAASFVVTISDFNRRYLARFGDERKIHVVRYGIPLDEFAARTAPPDGPFTIVSVASLQPYKGLRHLVDACALLRRDGREVRCLVAGGGELREELERQVEGLGLPGVVELLGPRTQDEVRELMRRASVFVLPSVVEPSGKMEGLPNVLLEALATGVPVVATSISGIPELVRPGETGQLVPPRDADALALAIADVMDDSEAASALARAGRALVEAEYDLERSVDAMARLFSESLARPTAEAA